MAMSSYNKSPLRPGKDYPGCIWTLIRLFHIRHGHSTLKLLSDRKHGNSKKNGNRDSGTDLDLLHNSQNRRDFDVADESQSYDFRLNMSSVKTLIDEEMLQNHHQNDSTTENSQQIVSDTGFKFHRNKSHKLTCKKLKGISDAHTKDLLEPVSLGNHQSNYAMNAEGSSLNFDLAALLLEYYGQGHQWQQLFVGGNVNSKVDICTALMTIYRKMHDHLDVPNSLLDKKWPMLVKALADLVEEITNQNVSDEKLLSALRAIGPKEFLNALDFDQIKEALLKILHDPLSHKRIVDARNSQVQTLTKTELIEYTEKVQLLEEEDGIPCQSDKSGSCEIQKKKRCRFFSKKEKSSAIELSNSSSNSLVPDTIVVLKPNPGKIENSSTTDSTCSSSQLQTKFGHKVREKSFSLKEIKRRIKAIFGESRKEQHAMSMDGVLHRLAIECHDLVDSNKLSVSEREEMNLVRRSFNAEDEAVTYFGSVDMPSKIGPEKCSINVEHDVACPLRANVVYAETGKHLAEMQDTREKTVSRQQDQALMPIEYDKPLPVSNQQTNIELDLLPKCIVSFQSEQCNLEDDDNSLSVSSVSEDGRGSEVGMVDSETEFIVSRAMDSSCIIVDLSNEETVPTVDNQLEMPLILQSNELDVVSECMEVETSFMPDLVMQNEKTRAVALSGLAPNPVKVENMMTPESTIERPGKGSPVSVLHKFDFSEEIMSPEHIDNQQLEPQQTHVDGHEKFPDAPTSSEAANVTTFCVKQARLMYIEVVLEASGLSTDDFLEKQIMDDQLLEPSLFDELGASCYPLDDDRKLLFDCINEVLLELQDRFSRYKSSVCNRKCNGRSFPTEVNLVREVSKTVDMYLSSELPETIEQMIQMDFCCKTWMNSQVEIEELVSELWDISLDDLMEEATFDSWFVEMR